MFRIGQYPINGLTALAPMAGVSDQPFRSICSAMGARLVVNEMVTSDTKHWQSRKSQTRLTWATSASPRVVQIAGSDPSQMAQAAQQCIELGAQVVDINMGCPAKKVCSKAAGSALLQDEALVTRILNAVVHSVDVPVTLKYRTGWCPKTRNAIKVAKIAEDAGIAALTLHGRTRACRFNGQAEYQSIAQVVNAVSLPVIANGDIDSPSKAKSVLQSTGAAAVMIGRAAQGNPWIFQQINQHLAGESLDSLSGPTYHQLYELLLQHIKQLHEFYGSFLGTRIARKHVSWYLQKQIHADHSASADAWRRHFQTLTEHEEQINAVHEFFERLFQLEDHAA